MGIQEFILRFAKFFEGMDPDDIQPETEYQELDDWSSLTALSIIALAKTGFGKTVTGIEVRRCKTVQELYDMITAK
jgi:acyl carrier protein